MARTANNIHVACLLVGAMWRTRLRVRLDVRVAACHAVVRPALACMRRVGEEEEVPVILQYGHLAHTCTHHITPVILITYTR